ncbi:MAG: CHASE3 domain-containing protein [Brasilonema angustatum HA4187-MV1]|nr:CHASE3 domain-containing protein [Brasilonema angustatum HA4187-MV1]
MKTLIKISVIEVSVGVLLLLGTVTASVIGLQQLEDSSSWVRHTYETKLRIDEIQILIRTAESEQRGYLLTNKSIYLNSDYNKTLQKLDKPFQTLLEAVKDNPEQHQRVVDCYMNVEKRLRILYDVVSLVRQGRNKEAKVIIDSGKGNLTQIQINQLLNIIKEKEEQLLTLRIANQQKAYRSVVTYLIFGEVISLVVVTGTVWTLIVRLRKQLLKA